MSNDESNVLDIFTEGFIHGEARRNARSCEGSDMKALKQFIKNNVTTKNNVPCPVSPQSLSMRLNFFVLAGLPKSAKVQICFIRRCLI